HGPIVLSGDDRFVIPVRALDEPYPHRRATLLNPASQLCQIIRALTMIGLQGDADVRPIAELLFHENLAENPQRQVLEGVLLHIDVDEDVPFAGGMKDRAKAPADGFACSFRIDGVELTVEG